MATFADLALGNAFPGPNVTFQQQYLTDNPDVAYQRLLQQQGVGGGASPFEQWLQQQYSRLNRGYQNELFNRPLGYSPSDYFGEQFPALQAQFRGLAPQQRGENPGLFGSKVRFL